MKITNLSFIVTEDKVAFEPKWGNSLLRIIVVNLFRLVDLRIYFCFNDNFIYYKYSDN